MEKFILSNAADAGLVMKDFDLPDDLKSLKKISKTVNSKKDSRFKKLFKAILKNQDSDFIKLKAWVETLKDNPYNDSIETLLKSQ